MRTFIPRFLVAPMAHVLPILAALVLAACHTVPLTSLPALSRIDPFALDAQALRAVVVHEPTLKPSEAPATLKLTLSHESGHKVEEEFILVDPPEAAGVPVPQGSLVTAYRIDPADFGRFERFQVLLRARKEARAGGNTFALSLQLQPCSESGVTGSVTAYIRVQTGGRLILVGRAEDLLAGAGVDVATCD